MSEPTAEHLTQIADITQDLHRHAVINICAGPEEEVYVLLHRGKPNYRIKTDHGTFARLRTDKPHYFRVLRIDQNGIERTEIADQLWNFYFVQPLPNRRLLLVCARCSQQQPADDDRNAHIFDTSGHAAGIPYCMGDGIEDVQSTANGEIWASYFDEGIFGTYGGESGLNRFADTGDQTYAYNPPSGFDAISDCYALNVSGEDDVWFYYYTEFRLVHLRKSQLANWWNPGIKGAHVFAIEDDLVLMQGGYDCNDTFKLRRLKESPKVITIREVRFANETGDVVSPACWTARGPNLYLYHPPIIDRIRPNDLK